MYDGGFTDSKSHGPFNWTLTSSTIGLAEREPGGRLHVIYYGQEEGVLASEGFRTDQILGVDDLCSSLDVSVALTGITSSELVDGVQYGSERIWTDSLAMRSRSRALRRIRTSHDPTYLREIGWLKTLDPPEGEDT